MHTPHDHHATRWLAETAQLDISEPRLRITAHKLTQCRQTLPARAAALHEFVRRMPLLAAGARGTPRASEVLRRGEGDGHAKSLLFVALCRAAGLPARLVFHTVRPRALEGLLNERQRPGLLVHAVAQVLVHGRWTSTDGYVIDPPLFAQARRRLQDAGLPCGWGIVAQAPGAWSGEQDCLQQFTARDVCAVHGPFDDIAQFESAQGAPATGWLARLEAAAFAHLFNRRLAELRRAPPVLPRVPAPAA